MELYEWKNTLFVFGDGLGGRHGKRGPKATPWPGYDLQKLIFEDYDQTLQARGPFDTLPDEIIQKIVDNIPANLDLKASAQAVKNFLITSKRLSRFLNDVPTNKSLMDAFGRRFYNKRPEHLSIAEQSAIAMALGTVGARRWLIENVAHKLVWQRNEDFLFEVVKRLPQADYKEIFNILVKKGANLNKYNAAGNSPLLQAIEDNNPEAALIVAAQTNREGRLLRNRNGQGDTAFQVVNKKMATMSGEHRPLLAKWEKLANELVPFLEEYQPEK